MYIYIYIWYISHGEDENTWTRVKMKVYKMQLKLDRNQNIVGYSKDEDLRFHIERIRFAYIFKYHVFFFLFLLNCTRIYMID
jgi:hypothetical protein